MEQLKLGRKNLLKAAWKVDFGMYLKAEGYDEKILLPKRYVPTFLEVGDEIEVFLYLDNEERLIATTEEPKIQVGEFATLECVDVNKYGAFLDWGLMKQLFCPFREQKVRMEVGKRYLVYCLIDEQSYRIMASSKVEKFQDKVKETHGGKTVNRVVVENFSSTLLRYLQTQGGRCRLGDKSSPEEIEQQFGVSKRIYKQAIGDLYKQHLITITPNGIELV